MNYQSLEVYQIAHELVIEIHKMTTETIPRFEMYETGSQIRRSIKSVEANIVEGYGRRIHQKQFLQFLIIALGSSDETMNHLRTLWDTGSLTDKILYLSLSEKLDKLGRKLHMLIKKVRTDLKNH